MNMPKLCATTLRHSWAHHRLESGQDSLIVSKLMGHVDGRMLATRYGHIEEGQRLGLVREGPPRVLVQLLTGLPNSVVRWYGPDGTMSTDELAALLTDVLLDGVAATTA